MVVNSVRVVLFMFGLKNSLLWTFEPPKMRKKRFLVKKEEKSKFVIVQHAFLGRKRPERGFVLCMLHIMCLAIGGNFYK